MRFFDPKLLWLLPVVAIFFPMLWSFFQKNSKSKLSLFASSELLKVLMDGLDYSSLLKRRRLKFSFLLFSALFGIIALARPQIGTHFENLKSEGLDMVFLLDVSNSMLTEDVVPNRLKKAKHILKNFTEKLSGDRAGIVAFARSAFPAVPLTSDYDYLRQTLDVLDETTIQNQGSDLASALDVAISLLDRGGINQKKSENEDSKDSSRVIIVLSDGEETEASDAEAIKTIVGSGVKIYSIAIGSIKGGPIPLRDPNGNLIGYKKDRSGNMVLSKIETDKLEKFANGTGGKFYTASANEGEVTEILDEIKSLDRSQGGVKQVLVYGEYFQIPLFIAILFLWLSFFIKERPSLMLEESHSITSVKSSAPKSVSMLALLFLCFSLLAVNASASSLKEYQENKAGLDAYSTKQFDVAIDHFTKAQASNPDQDEHYISIGDAYLRSGDVDNAVKEFDQATASTKPEVASKAYFNKGKAFASVKQQDKAIESFQKGLEHELDSAKPDPEMVQRFKRALEQGMNQKNNQQQDDKDKQDKKQQDKDDKKKDQDKEDQSKKDSDKDSKKNDPVKEPQKQKPNYKPEKISEDDARKIMRQLQEQEKKEQQMMMQRKTGRKQNDNDGKDW